MHEELPIILNSMIVVVIIIIICVQFYLLQSEYHLDVECGVRSNCGVIFAQKKKKKSVELLVRLKVVYEIRFWIDLAIRCV